MRTIFTKSLAATAVGGMLVLGGTGVAAAHTGEHDQDHPQQADRSQVEDNRGDIGGFQFEDLFGGVAGFDDAGDGDTFRDSGNQSGNETDNSETDNSETDNSETDNSETDNSETDNSETGNGNEFNPSVDPEVSPNVDPEVNVSPETDNSETDNSETDNSETDNSETDNSETDNSETDNSEDNDTETDGSESDGEQDALLGGLL